MPHPTSTKLMKELLNIGPCMAVRLINAGIDTPEKLRKLGAQAAYTRMLELGAFNGKIHANYLCALEGAILNCHWREVPKQTKEKFKAFTKHLRAKQGTSQVF